MRLNHRPNRIPSLAMALLLSTISSSAFALSGNDCNGNGHNDQFDIDHGLSLDCNLNSIPDECDLTSGSSADCNGNAVPDDCDTVASYTMINLNSGSSPVFALVKGDIDNDGDEDIAGTQADFGDKFWFERLSDGTLVPHEITGSVFGGPLQLIDVDEDGDLDYVTAYHTAGWFENTDGLGAFGPPQAIVLDQTVDLRRLVDGDVDGDGDTDLIMGHWDCPESVWGVLWVEHEQEAAPFVKVHEIFLELNNCAEYLFIDAADVDTDGDIDVMMADGTGTVSWFENLDGAGNFGDQRTIGPGFWATAADIDSDGDPDVVSTLSWFENLDGAGHFGPPREFTQSVAYANVADMDGDGDLDIVTGSSADDIVEWHENVDGQGQFTAHHTIGTAPGTPFVGYSIVTTDTDHDGDLDVLAPSQPWHFVNVNQDCDADGIPDSCQADCNASGRADICDVRRGYSADCNRNLVPDECELSCPGGCDADLDSCVDALDCAPANDAVWADPSSARSLVLQSSTPTLRWNPPAEPGAATVRYDLLRSSNPADFGPTAVCVEFDDFDTIGDDPAAPSSGAIFYYLIRAENDCAAGSGAMGADSSGLPRSGRSCP